MTLRGMTGRMQLEFDGEMCDWLNTYCMCGFDVVVWIQPTSHSVVITFAK